MFQLKKEPSGFCQKALDTARLAFDHNGEHSPIVLTNHETFGVGCISVAGIPKDLVSRLMRMMAKTCDEIVYISEAWIVQRQASDPKSEDLKKQMQRMAEFAERQDLSEHPDRTEVLLIMWSTSDREVMATARIERLGSSKPRLGEWDYMDTGNPETCVEGRFTNIYREENE